MTYHGALIVNALYDSISDAIRSLDASTTTTILPDGSTVIPLYENYPKEREESILQPYYPGTIELWPGDEGYDQQL